MSNTHGNIDGVKMRIVPREGSGRQAGRL